MVRRAVLRRRGMASCNVLVLGGRGVGKTALISTFVNGAFRKVGTWNTQQSAEIIAT